MSTKNSNEVSSYEKIDFKKCDFICHNIRPILQIKRKKNLFLFYSFIELLI